MRRWSFNKALFILPVLMGALGVQATPAVAGEPARLPILVPLTGFLALEGASQRDGALLALMTAKGEGIAKGDVADTGTAPEGAVTALDRAMSSGPVPAVVASMLGTQMLAMAPLAAEYKVPLITVSGTAAITQQGNPWIFRFFPGDAVTKAAHARHVVTVMGKRAPAIIHQTTAYGQSGRQHLVENLEKLGVKPVFVEGVDASVKDLSPVIAKAMAAKPDVLLLHLHAGPTALFIRQARALGIDLPIVAGSAMHQPATAALLEPEQLRGVCAETASSPISGETEAARAFTAAYRAAFGSDPDAFALGQYDGVMMVLDAMRAGATTAEQVRQSLANRPYEGVAMTYRSNGAGDMARSAVIICYDGQTRVPKVVARYDTP